MARTFGNRTWFVPTISTFVDLDLIACVVSPSSSDLLSVIASEGLDFAPPSKQKRTEARLTYLLTRSGVEEACLKLSILCEEIRRSPTKKGFLPLRCVYKTKSHYKDAVLVVLSAKSPDKSENPTIIKLSQTAAELRTAYTERTAEWREAREGRRRASVAWQSASQIQIGGDFANFDFNDAYYGGHHPPTAPTFAELVQNVEEVLFVPHGSISNAFKNAQIMAAVRNSIRMPPRNGAIECIEMRRERNRTGSIVRGISGRDTIGA